MIYRLAPMSAVMWVVTVALLAIPVVVVVAGLLMVGLALAVLYLWVVTVALLAIPVVVVAAGLLIVGLALAVLYLWVWLWMRPRHFVIDDDAMVIAWPLRSRRIRRAELRSARTITAREFRREHGLAVRIGVGGLWGGFGLLWTRAKTFDMYVSRGDGLVILERDTGRPLLITPERPEEFIRAAQGSSQDSKAAPRR